MSQTTKTGRSNIIGLYIAKKRKAMVKKTSQKQFSEYLQASGINIDKNALQRIEMGLRSVTDIEVVQFARFFNIPVDEMLSMDEPANIGSQRTK